jgi:hypothetical protein
VVVFPTPPFWFATVRMRANAGPPFYGNTTVSCTMGGRGAKGGKSRARVLLFKS